MFGFVISELLSLSCLQETSHACDEVHRPASPRHLTPHVKGALESSLVWILLFVSDRLPPLTPYTHWHAVLKGEVDQKAKSRPDYWRAKNINSKHINGWNHLDVWQITFVKHLSSLLLLAELKVPDCVHAPSHCRPTLKLLVDKSFGVYNAPGQ